jgi:WD40 repeat protein
MCNCDCKPNGIFESGNIIVTVGKKIEVFTFSFDNNNNLLTKERDINIDNNNNNNNNNINIINNDNSNNNNEILCIEFGKGFAINGRNYDLIVCGHKSGSMSIWEPLPQVYLQKLQETQLHNGPINKILYTQLSNNKNYLISCSSDKSIKIYCMEENNVVKTKTFESEVMDIQLVKDFNQKNTFILSLKNGALKALNEKLEEIFEIPSRFKTSIVRHVIPLSNPNNNNGNTDNTGGMTNNNKGDILLITEGKFIDVFEWIQEGSFKVKPHNNKSPFKHPPKGHSPHFPHFPGQFHAGGY